MSGGHSPLSGYDGLVRRFVRQIPDIFPDRVRVNAERLSREIGIQAFLASQVWKNSGPSGQTQAENTHSSEANHRSRADSSSPSQDQKFLSTSVISQVPDLLQQLRLHTTVGRPKLTGINTTAVTAILDYVPEETSDDPMDYSFEQLEERVTQAKKDLEKERNSSSKSRTKTKEKKKIAFEKTQGGRMGSRQDIGASTQVPNTGLVQVIEGPPLNMTQPERGRFGGRDKQKKGKLRVAGF
jgi:hypothetical protein